MKQLVIYRLNPANEAPFHELFRTVTKRVMLRLGFRIDGIWSAERRPLGDVSLCEVVYLLTWPDLETMDRAWDALNADSEILERRAAIRERHGASVTEITNRLLTATDYSPDPN